MSNQTDIERIIENQLSDLTLPCDMRDIRIRMAGAVQQCLAGKDADIARLEAQLKIGTSIDNNGNASPYMGRTADEWLSIDRENVQLRARLAEAEKEFADGEKVSNAACSEYLRRWQNGRRRQFALESQCQKMRDALTQIKERRPFPADKTDVYDWMNQAEKLIEWAITAPLDLELLGRVSSILAAVQDSEFGGIECKDVNGQNWFDARDALLKSLSPSPNPSK